MIRSFGDEATHDVFRGRATRAARRLPMTLWPVIVRKLRMLEVFGPEAVPRLWSGVVAYGDAGVRVVDARPQQEDTR